VKFRIRFADQIVGFLIVVALISLVAIIFLLGSRQRWFARDYQYKTYAASASGLSENMPVLLKGIQIGAVKTFHLTGDDQVEVIFTIYDSYADRVKQGSLVQILISPIGLGNQFLFYPGLGSEALEENSFIPAVGSAEGQELIARGQAFVPSQSDSIAKLMSRVDDMLASLNKTVNEVNLALAGDNTSVLGRTLGDVERTVAALPEEMAEIQQVTRDIGQIVQDLNVLSQQLAGSDGVLSLLDGEGTLVTGLESSIQSLSGILSNVEKTTAYLPREMPQVFSLLTEVRSAVEKAEEVLTALSNNPLLKGGVPKHIEADTSGTNLRGVRF
jgi:phospholipid/cholesterol/gamma-HCH transport system substrate-binding protein